MISEVLFGVYHIFMWKYKVDIWIFDSGVVGINQELEISI
jgi:hypothetical protein